MRWFRGVGSSSPAVFVRWVVCVETPLLLNVLRRPRPGGASAAGCTRPARGRASTAPRRPGKAGGVCPRAVPAFASATQAPAAADRAHHGARCAACGQRDPRTSWLLGWAGSTLPADTASTLARYGRCASAEERLARRVRSAIPYAAHGSERGARPRGLGERVMGDRLWAAPACVPLCCAHGRWVLGDERPHAARRPALLPQGRALSRSWGAHQC